MLEGKYWQLRAKAFFWCAVWVNSLPNLWEKTWWKGSEPQLLLSATWTAVKNRKMPWSPDGNGKKRTKGTVSSGLKGSNILWLEIIFFTCTMILTFRGVKKEHRRGSQYRWRRLIIPSSFLTWKYKMYYDTTSINSMEGSKGNVITAITSNWIKAALKNSDYCMVPCCAGKHNMYLLLTDT